MAAAAAARALLDKNGDLTVEQYSAGLAKILGNILAHPAEEKYRRIKAKAKLVQQTILAADGGLQAFLALGFRKEAMTASAFAAAAASNVRAVDDDRDGRGRGLARADGV